MSAKTAINIWGTCTKMLDDAAHSNNDQLRVGDDCPADSARGPERGAEKELQFLYPSEVVRFCSCEAVPLGWRQLAAFGCYTYLRAGELRVLRRDDVHLDQGTIRVHRACDRTPVDTTTTKGRKPRRVPVELALRPCSTQ